MELIDIYDENMNQIGMIDKKIAHEKGLWHKNTNIWVVNDKGEILIQQRANKGQFPFHWDTAVVGHPIAGEKNIIESAKREWEEELGLPWTFGDVKESFIIKTPNNFFNTNSPFEPYAEFQYVWLFKKNIDLAKVNMQKEEVAAVKYVNFEDFKKLINSKDFVKYSQQYKSKILKMISEELNIKHL